MKDWLILSGLCALGLVALAVIIIVLGVLAMYVERFFGAAGLAVLGLIGGSLFLGALMYHETEGA